MEEKKFAHLKSEGEKNGINFIPSLMSKARTHTHTHTHTHTQGKSEKFTHYITGCLLI